MKRRPASLMSLRVELITSVSAITSQVASVLAEWDTNLPQAAERPWWWDLGEGRAGKLPKAIKNNLVPGNN